MVFQIYALYPHMTVRDNTAFALQLAGVSKEERYAAIDEVADLLQLKGAPTRLVRSRRSSHRMPRACSPARSWRRMVTIVAAEERNFEMRLKDKIAIVTGGASGIGEAIVRGYVAEGAAVVIADVDIAKGEALAVELGGKALAIRLDVRETASIDALVAATVSKLGGIDILVNNAGVFNMAPLSEITETDFDRQFGINVRGLIFVTKAVVAQMERQGRGGKIINMSSQAGRRGEANVTVYCASKAAVISITQSLGRELIKSRINVNAIAPGVVDTPMWDQVDALFAKYEKRPLGEKKRLVGEAVPAGRMGVPDDYRGPAIFLASAEADYVVAQTLNVDGGNWMS
jgi:D-sorbitol dehydrogenase (acceptor)